MVINRAKFDVCTSNSFGEIKAYIRTFIGTDRIALYILDLCFYKQASKLITKQDLHDFRKHVCHFNITCCRNKSYCLIHYNTKMKTVINLVTRHLDSVVKYLYCVEYGIRA